MLKDEHHTLMRAGQRIAWGALALIAGCIAFSNPLYTLLITIVALITGSELKDGLISMLAKNRANLVSADKGISQQIPLSHPKKSSTAFCLSQQSPKQRSNPQQSQKNNEPWQSLDLSDGDPNYYIYDRSESGQKNFNNPWLYPHSELLDEDDEIPISPTSQSTNPTSPSFSSVGSFNGSF
jgi:hypothetical protein